MDLDRERAASGISPARLSALSVLVFGGDRTVGELASAEQVRSPTMSRLVGEMEAQGLVERRRSSADARAMVVRATAKGRRTLQAARRRRVARLAEWLERLEPHHLALLERAAALIEEVARDGTSSGSSGR